MKAWTPTENALIRLHYPDKGAAWLRVNHFDLLRSRAAIQRQAAKLGVRYAGKGAKKNNASFYKKTCVCKTSALP